jgi:ATP-binding cassette subfamily B multidrug efflux pump
MKRPLQFLWLFMRKEIKILVLGILLTAMVSTLTWLGPKIIAYIIDNGLQPKNTKVAMVGVLFLALSEGGRLLSTFLSQVIYAVLGQNVIERVRARLVSHLIELPVSYFDQTTSGGLMTRVVNDVNSLSDFFQSGFVSVLGNLASILAIFVGLWNLNFKLGSVLFLSFLPIAFACSRFSKRLRSVYELTRNELAKLNSMLADFLFGMRTIRSLGGSVSKHDELNSQIQNYADSLMQMVRTFALFQPTLSLGIGIMLLILLAMGIPLVSDQALKVGEWVAALSYVIYLQQPLVEISDRWNFFLAGLTSVNRIMEVLDESAEKIGPREAARFEKVEFSSVNFTYSGAAHPALLDVQLRIRRGEWIGIYGESGSGKSTLLQMIYGFYLPSTGVLSWNGDDYQELNLKSVRRHFGVVEQFPFLFSGTIEENITLFGEHAFDLESLRREFPGFSLIQSLLQNPQFEINERGNNLSMGQKQMIAFLRSYLARPDVWILDEATAFFDEEAEHEVVRALEALGDQVTVIQVAHRPEALQKMQRLLQVSQGRLQEQSMASKPKD